MVGSDIGIDLGTASILVYIKGKGVVLKEPSVVAFDRDTNKIKAIGEEARLMLGRTPGNIVAVRPLRQGVISDYTVTEKMIKHFIQKALGKKSFRKPLVSVCVPSGVTEVEKKAVEDATFAAGARDVKIIEEPIAAAIGAGIDISKPCGNMIVDIGGGTSDLFGNGFVKNKVMEFVGPGVSNLSVDFRIGVDVMTTETTCLSSIWRTDDQVKEFFEIHGRAEDHKELNPGEVAYYDRFIEIDLSQIRPMIAMPFHPSNTYTIDELNANHVHRRSRHFCRTQFCTRTKRSRSYVVYHRCVGHLLASIIRADSSQICIQVPSRPLFGVHGRSPYYHCCIGRHTRSSRQRNTFFRIHRDLRRRKYTTHHMGSGHCIINQLKN